MTEPTTVNVALVIPNTGDLVGSWGTTAVNVNMLALDGMLGGTLAFALGAATTVVLTAPSPITPGAGPTQSQNSCLFFSGTLTGNAVFQFTMPGRYVVHNKCTVGTNFVQLAPSAGGGNAIGVVPGKKVSVFYDGTNMDFMDPPDPGTAYDLHGATSIPAWMSACTVLPYLLKDGTVYNVATYPALGAALGSTFGGNGITTFGVPDERARARIGYDGGATNRLTTAVSGVNGATMGSAGGDQNLASHTHTATVNDPGHTHTYLGEGANQFGAGFAGGFAAAATGNSKTGITITNSTTGSGSSQNVQPTIISFLPLIKT